MVSVIYEKKKKKRFSEMLLAPSMFPLYSLYFEVA